jgi:hypothetical protein
MDVSGHIQGDIKNPGLVPQDESLQGRGVTFQCQLYIINIALVLFDLFLKWIVHFFNSLLLKLQFRKQSVAELVS